jgi:hypothetical protein
MLKKNYKLIIISQKPIQIQNKKNHCVKKNERQTLNYFLSICIYFSVIKLIYENQKSITV